MDGSSQQHMLLVMWRRCLGLKHLGLPMQVWHRAELPEGSGGAASQNGPVGMAASSCAVLGYLQGSRVLLAGQEVRVKVQSWEWYSSVPSLPVAVCRVLSYSSISLAEEHGGPQDPSTLVCRGVIQ